MTKVMTALAAGLVALWLGGTAAAQTRDLSIQAFAGTWQGSAISESTVSVTFAVTMRDLDVMIRPSGSGFDIAWTTILHQKGDPENPTEVRKSSRMRFVGTGRAGVFRGEANGDPMDGGAFAWAHIRDHTLSMSVLTIAADGAYTMQVYERTLSPSGMALDFRRIVGGVVERTVQGRLIKFAE